MIYEVFIMALIGGIIGWITNMLAIKMLFRPIEPIKIPFTKIKIQGLIPRRRNEIAKSIGDTIEKELLSISDIINNIADEQNKKDIIKIFRDKIITFVGNKIPFIVPASIKAKIIEYIGEQIDKDVESIIHDSIEDLANIAAQKIKIGDIVEEKINNFDLVKIETMIISIASKELKHIEYLGGLLGFLIGVLQGIVVQFI